MEWQPIETAPRDCSNFDVWVDWRGRVTDVIHDGEHFRELTLDQFDGMSWEKLDGNPTHWMPLPNPPEEAT